MQRIEDKRLEKKLKWGGFSRGVYNEYVELNSDNEYMRYYHMRYLEMEVFQDEESEGETE